MEKINFIKKLVVFFIVMMHHTFAFAQTPNCISSVVASGWQKFEQHNVGIGAITTAVYFGVNNNLPTLTYQWYVNDEDENNGGTLIANAVGSKYVPSSAVIGVFYYYCVVSGAVSCGLNSNISNTIKIEVKPKSNINLPKGS